MKLFKSAGKTILSLIIVAAIIAGILWYLGQGIEDTSIEGFVLTGITEVSTESFTLNGVLTVENPSELIVPIDSIEYDVYLEETNELIGSGTLPSFTLETGLTKIPFEQEINWVPTTQMATQLATQEEVLVQVEGVVHIQLPEIDPLALPFSAEQDIKEYVTQFVPVDTQPITETTETVSDQTPTDEDTLIEDATGVLG